MTTEDQPERLLTVREVAERWQVSERTVVRLIDAGELKASHIGRQRRVPPDEVRKYEKRNGR